MTKISVCCLTFNSARTVGAAIESVRSIADEIIVVDSGSTDDTLDIVKKFGCVVYRHAYSYHGLQMNYAIDRAAYDWVFCLDSDEMLDEKMASHLLKLKEKGLEEVEAYRLLRDWHFLGGPVHAFYPASSPDKIVRLFDRRISRFNEKPVHDKPVGFRTTAWLEGRLIHDSTGNIHELFDKMNKYTTRHAKGYADTASKATVSKILLAPAGAFLKWYFVKRNVRDGFRGFILASYAAVYTFMKYVKLYHVRSGNEND